jgi:hypothetical protein
MGFMAPDQEEEARVGEECGILPKTDDMRLRRIRDRPFPTKVTDDDASGQGRKDLMIGCVRPARNFPRR